jgi:CBS domain-containing protein
MNIAFFLIPKSNVVYMSIESTMRQALEKMDNHPYTAIPLIDDSGAYVGTLSEGDLLWELKRREVFSLKDLEKIPIRQVERHFRHRAVSIYEDIRALLRLALDQTFVPVLDDQDMFIGIVTRKAIIEFFAKEYLEKHELANQELDTGGKNQ